MQATSQDRPPFRIGNGPLVVGNWKMNGGRADLAELAPLRAIADRHGARLQLAVALPATLLVPASEALPGLIVGAQDVHAADGGAFTGSISAPMLRDAGGRFVLAGHSERRQHHGETDAQVRAKAEAALRHGLGAIVCVGETLAERAAGRSPAVVAAQVARSVPAGFAPGAIAIAYEPVWSIGTGLVPDAAEIERVHRGIRAALDGKGAGPVPILYGGSVTAANAGALVGLAGVDGVLVGGASLRAGTFAPLAEAAMAGAPA